MASPLAHFQFYIGSMFAFMADGRSRFKAVNRFDFLISLYRLPVHFQQLAVNLIK